MKLEELGRLSPFHRVLSSNGDGTGVTNANQDYSGMPLILFAALPPTQRYIVSSVKLFLETDSTMLKDGYGNTNADNGLPNGIEMYTEKPPYGEVDSRIFDLTRCCIIKNSADLFILAQQKIPENWDNITTINPEWQGHQWGMSLGMDGKAGHRFVVKLNDNFEGLLRHHIFIAGLIADPPRFHWK